ncbi:MAG: thermonuclease family protein [Thermoanaerobaculia bacterium]
MSLNDENLEIFEAKDAAARGAFETLRTKKEVFDEKDRLANEASDARNLAAGELNLAVTDFKNVDAERDAAFRALFPPEITSAELDVVVLESDAARRTVEAAGRVVMLLVAAFLAIAAAGCGSTRDETKSVAAWSHSVTIEHQVAKPHVAMKPAPDYGICIGGTIKRVKDGDTLVFTPDPVDIDVRLLECWAPEKTGASKAAGLAATENLKKLAEGKHARLFVPVSTKLAELTTLSRTLGDVWIDGDSEDLATRQRRAGHAFRTKPKVPVIGTPAKTTLAP